jgi:hypothetical protein
MLETALKYDMVNEAVEQFARCSKDQRFLRWLPAAPPTKTNQAANKEPTIGALTVFTCEILRERVFM